ncbi:MAG TPA: bifunctional DNA-binding transcriptional regulator/O6-methylguanine-DNA methyltransferase Ada [Allosphingosinicella sp.]|jgi:AraC family transcriptional regulator of adaptative response/methylated-DNA-[protein]-cysteine methyltransferase|nr:bifunctional DNA-binding transcriptional regulator/O6-methylguanine-DNA methyltransferase Ada [Allosphingosinicella sp.]
MASLATIEVAETPQAVNDRSIISDDEAWAAVLRRDRVMDGRFVTGVLTTGIYCRPSCAARHPRRENVRFFATGGEARAAGLRACLRCRPDEVTREGKALERAYRLLAEAEETPSLEALAAAAGYSPHHFHRLFKRATGVTPAAYYRSLRARRAEAALEENGRITDAIYDAGYSGPGRFYADAKGRLGMTPSAWRDGGRGETIRWATAETDLGTMLVAATDRGICRLSFDEDEAGLRQRFPNAVVEPGGAAMGELVRRTVAAVNAPEKPHDLPLDVRGTAFQEAVWRELSRIPPGESLSYAALAARAGRPAAVRAAGTACGANNIAVLIPCHRARRGNGSPGGYAYGLERKAKLLEREGWKA